MVRAHRVLLVALLAPRWVAGQDNAPFDSGLLARIRQTATTTQGALPTSVNVLVVNRFSPPLSCVVEGAPADTVPAMNAVFQIRFATDWIMVDAVMDSARWTGRGFRPAAMHDANEALLGARLIVVTHEHDDHAGTVVEGALSGQLAPKTMFTSEQLQTLQTSPNKTWLRIDEAKAAKYQALRYQDLWPLAPGVVLIKAPGHTPGSQMVYVRVASGSELILVGDVAWMTVGIDQGRQKPLSISQNASVLGVPEQRQMVAAQLEWLRSVKTQGVNLVVAHDMGAVDRLVQTGVLRAGLQVR